MSVSFSWAACPAKATQVSANCLLGALRVLALLALVVLHATALDASKSLTQYAHRIWGQEEGLFQPTIYSILQTRDGFLWLGTQDSLIRFDGVHFHEFRDGASVLHGSLIRALLQDRQGNLWAASIGSGIARIGADGSVKHYSTRNGLPSNAVFCLASDSVDSIWACTNQGLVRLSESGIRVFTTADGLPSKNVRSTCQTPDGTRWVSGLDSGLSRWTGSRFTSYANNQISAKDNITALACAADGSVWAGRSSGLTQIKGARTHSFTVHDGLPDNEVSALAAEPDGTLWIGTNDGISRYRRGDFSIYRTRDGLSHSQVMALFPDREGSLWAGTKDGLDQFTDGKVTPYTTNEGLPSNDVGPVLEDSHGLLWVGTLGRGLNYFDGRHFRALTAADGLVNNTVLSLALDRSGDLWVGTKGGLNRVRGGRITATYTTADGLSSAEIRSLFVDSDGQLWVGSKGGLDTFNGTRFARSDVIKPLDRSGVVALSGGHSVQLFASVEQPALYLLRDRIPSLYPVDITHAVDCYFLDHLNHTTWMGTLGSGLLRWKNGSMFHVYVKDGLYDNRIYSILRDDKSNFWLASSKGIFRVSQKELDDFADGDRKSVSSIPFSTGQLRFECRAGVQPAACRTRDGRLWFSTTSGLVVIDPDRLLHNRVAPPVSITAIVINGQRVESFQNLRLEPWQTNNVEIRYAGLSFISPEKVAFRYMLDGHGKSWVDAGARREAFFTNLPHGKYRFRVQARNADGVWSSAPASLNFTVEPRIYQRGWFFPLLACVLGLLTIAGYRLRIRRLRERFDLVLAERNRIARELHDTLLQGLSGITMQLQALWMKLPASKDKSRLGEIIGDAGRCSTEARQSLWGLRSPELGSREFSEELAEVARQAIASRRIALVCEIEPVSLRAFPEVEYQLLRIAREALANVLKHSNAMHLTVTLRSEARRLLLSVEDDGVGFSNLTQQARGHFGVQGMKERANDIGAELSIVSSTAQGTRVLVSLDIGERSRQEGNLQALGAHQLE